MKKLTLEELLRKSKEVTYADIKREIGMTRKTAKSKIQELREKGVPVKAYLDNEYITHFCLDTSGKPEIRTIDLGLKDGNYKFLAISDLHMGDKQFKEGYLNDAFDKAEDEGVSYITNSGDLVAGVSVYHGQQADLQYHTLDEQIDYVISAMPKIEGVKQYIIGGNHDYDAVKRLMINPVQAVANYRSDIEFIGWTDAKLDIGNGVISELVHYKGSMAWSLGYRSQKFLRDLNPHNMPNILLLGHKHVTMYAYIQGVHAFECGTFQGETNFTRERGMHSQISCWIIEYTIENGKLVKLKPELLVYD